MKKATIETFSSRSASTKNGWWLKCKICEKEQLITESTGFTQEFVDDHNLIYHDLFDGEPEEKEEEVKKGGGKKIASKRVDYYGLKFEASKFESGAYMECLGCHDLERIEAYTYPKFGDWAQKHVMEAHKEENGSGELIDEKLFEFTLGQVSIKTYTKEVIITHLLCHPSDDSSERYYDEHNAEAAYHWAFQHLRLWCSARDLTDAQANALEENFCGCDYDDDCDECSNAKDEYDDYDAAREGEGVVGEEALLGINYTFSFGKCNINRDKDNVVRMTCYRCFSAEPAVDNNLSSSNAYISLKQHIDSGRCHN